MAGGRWLRLVFSSCLFRDVSPRAQGAAGPPAPWRSRSQGLPDSPPPRNCLSHSQEPLTFPPRAWQTEEEPSPGPVAPGGLRQRAGARSRPSKHIFRK